MGRNIEEIALISTLASDSEIGVIYAGNYLQMPQNIYGGHSPISLNEDVTYQSSESEGGQILSRNIIRRGSSGVLNWELLSDVFVRNEFLDFKKSAQAKPFFIKWRPDFYSDDVLFAQTEGKIAVSNMGGGHRLMSASMKIKAHSDL